MKTTKKIFIDGMHCTSCEILITRSSETIAGVRVKNISANKGTMDVEYSDEKALPLIHQCICDAGYKVLDSEKANNNKINIKNLGISLLIVSVLAFVFYKLDFVKYLPSTTNASYGVALLMGIIASVSTCLAIVGSIVIGFSQYLDKSKGIGHHIKTQLSFHAGRVGGFFLLGGILGLVGKAISISLTATTIMTIIVGIVVLWMGLHLLKILPNISALGVHLPNSRSNKALSTKNQVFAPLIGALTFFLPCGFTLSMQLIAINSGSFWQGGLVMAIFALGTLPILFAVGLGSSYVKENKMKLLQTVIGTLIVFFGVFMISNGRSMLGGAATLTNDNNAVVDQNTVYETVNLGHDGLSLVPEVVTLIAGKNYELIITPSDNGKGCMSNLTIPKLDRSVHTIIKNQPIIYKFANIKAGKYSVVCGTMGMYQGQIIVQ